MKGSLVIARCYEGLPVVLRVWEMGNRVIYLSEDSQFQKLMAGMEALPPIGFPPDDVFAYDPKLSGRMSGHSIDWSKLPRFLKGVSSPQ
jgi:hypothetical protein